MSKPISGSRLKELRERRGLSQDGLAKSFKPAVDKQTIYRWESDDPPLVRRKNLVQLVMILDVEEGVLTGDLPLPPKAVDRSDESAEGYYEMRFRVDGRTRNAFSLASLRYGMPIADILKIAPLLLVHAAEGSLARRRRLYDEFRQVWEKEGELVRRFAHLPFGTVDYLRGENQEGSIFAAEQESIAARDIFGKRIAKSKEIEWSFPGGGFEDEWETASEEKNPFAEFLREAAEEYGSRTVVETLDGGRFTSYTICRDDAIALTGGDEGLAEGLLNGWVLLHEIPRNLRGNKVLAERIDWLRPRIDEARENVRRSNEQLQNMSTDELLQCLDLLPKSNGDEP